MIESSGPLTFAEVAMIVGAMAGGAVELRARALRGAHKIWLECNAPSACGRWSATANVAHHMSIAGTGYREAAPEIGATKELPIPFGDDGDGVTATASPSTRRTGALTIPRGGGLCWLQLMTLPPCPDGAEIFVSVAVADLTEPRVTFRAFVGVSAA
jgi:hypothetical protein